METKTVERNWGLDLLRILAAFTVVMLHVSPQAYLDVEIASAPWNVMNAITGLCCWNVSAFFMLSGAFLLAPQKTMSTRTLYRKNIARLAAAFVFWSAVYALTYCLLRGKGKWTFLNELLRGHYHMWFVFTLISLYAVVPLLRKITESKKATEYFLLIGFLFTSLIGRALNFALLFELPHKDVLQSLQSACAQLNPYRGLTALYAFVLGHYLMAYPLPKAARRLLYAAGCLSCLMTIWLTRWHSAVLQATSAVFTSGAALGVLLLVLSLPLLEMMGCPADVVGGAQLYLNIYAVGLPASLVYNYGAAILRAVGDTKRPLYYLTVSGLVNVVLNVALVAGLRLGVAGVAIATVVSETISAALVLASLIASHGDIRFEPKKTRIERRALAMILRIGIPAGLQSSMFSISNVLIQSAINSFGAAAIAGNTAAASIEGFATTVSNSISQAALTFSSQNMGAEKYARVRRVLCVCLAATFVGGLTLGLLIYTFGTPLLALFNTDPAVIASGLVRVRHNMPLYVLFCMQDTFVGQLRGVGYSLLPTITSLSGICLLRVVWLYTAFAASPTLDTLYLSYPVSWAATLFALVVCYAVVVRKMPREL